MAYLHFRLFVHISRPLAPGCFLFLLGYLKLSLWRFSMAWRSSCLIKALSPAVGYLLFVCRLRVHRLQISPCVRGAPNRADGGGPMDELNDSKKRKDELSSAELAMFS